MKLEGEQALLRLHMSNFAKWHMGPLYEALVGRARHEQLAGATVLSGIYGFMDRGPIVGDHAGFLQAEQPVVLEIVDQEASLMRFLEAIEPMITGHAVMATLERSHVVHYRGGGPEVRA